MKSSYIAMRWKGIKFSRMEKSVSEALQYRRAVRLFDPERPINPEEVRQCLQLATLAPNSSNLQLWEFHHVCAPSLKAKIAEYSFGQNAAKTADQFVVVVVRKDLWPQRAKWNIDSIKALQLDAPPHLSDLRLREVIRYYDRLIPFLYFDIWGILGWIKWLFFAIVGLFRPVYREVTACDMRIVAHKSAALAAQSFMLLMAARGYDTCPMEGIDTRRIRKLLRLPRSAEINMVIACGIRTDKGIYGPRLRVPFSEVYRPW